MIARLVWDQAVGGLSPSTPTKHLKTMDKFQKIYSKIVSEGISEEDKLSQYVGMTLVRLPSIKLRPNFSKGVWKSNLQFDKMTIKSIETGENGITKIVCVSPDGSESSSEVHYIDSWLQYRLEPNKPDVYAQFDDSFDSEVQDINDFVIIVNLPWTFEKFAPTLEQVAQAVKTCISLERKKAEQLVKRLSDKEAELDTIR